MKRKERKVAWAITEDYSKGIKGHYKLKTWHRNIKSPNMKAFLIHKSRGKYSCTGILVFPGWEWKIYYSSRITFHERHVWINLMFLNFVKNFPVRIFWEELLSAQAHIFLVSYEKILKWISFDAGTIFPFRNAWMELLLQIFLGLLIFRKN